MSCGMELYGCNAVVRKAPRELLLRALAREVLMGLEKCIKTLFINVVALFSANFRNHFDWKPVTLVNVKGGFRIELFCPCSVNIFKFFVEDFHTVSQRCGEFVLLLFKFEKNPPGIF